MSAFEFVSAFGLDKEIIYSLSHPANFSLVDSGIPQRTSSSLLSTLTDRLDQIHNKNFDLHDSSLSHIPAALSHISVFLYGDVGTCLHDRRHWIKALEADPQTKLFLAIVSNPGVDEDNVKLNTLHSLYRQAARHFNFSVGNSILYMKEIFQHDTKHIKL